MPQTIRVRDVVRDSVLSLEAARPALRVPYDLFKPTGPVRRRGTLVEWQEGGVAKTGSVVATELGETHPGERVLVELGGGDARTDWWLCEVQQVEDPEPSPPAAATH